MPFVIELCRKYPEIKIWDAQETANSLYDEFFVGGADDGRSMMELYELTKKDQVG